jgi:hypothetical protein
MLTNVINNFEFNLEWCTAQYNVLHSIENGRRTRKSNLRGNDIFTTSQVRAIKDALNRGYVGRRIAEYFKCSDTTKVGKHYPHV